MLPNNGVKPLLVFDRSEPNVDSEYILRAIDLLLGYLNLAGVNIHNFMGDSGSENFPSFASRHRQINHICLLTILLASLRGILMFPEKFLSRKGEKLVIKDMGQIRYDYLNSLASPSFAVCKIGLCNCINKQIESLRNEESSVWNAFLHSLKDFNANLHTQRIVDDEIRKIFAKL